ncbi:C2H2-like zinc finger protein, putative [Medicago truncatula]|uniref:C2H2-like zinc finger protein, putative n=1 Tax=Medicago truncatula TaxID=3880 RepID=G7KF44_MEDTR|nr:C2H2-like zinc finger protein, putative [Medicago truncatula]
MDVYGLNMIILYAHADPEAEVISLSPKPLMATNRFVCEICLKDFQRDQNLQLHRRGYNLPRNPGKLLIIPWLLIAKYKTFP